MMIKQSDKNRVFAKSAWPDMAPQALQVLDELTVKFGFNIERGELIWLDRGWYVTHTGLLRIASAKRCAGIEVQPMESFCNPDVSRWTFKAIVYRNRNCRGFSGFGDADPSNVSPAMHGAELRIAETRAVNRALRKAYGIGLCSVEELGTTPAPPSNGNAKKAPARVGANLEVIAAIPLRDQLRQIIRHHKLDPVLTKSYALAHLQLKSLRDATREQVRELVEHLQKRLFEDREGFLGDLAKVTTTESGKEVA
jgi:hypothetical protein